MGSLLWFAKMLLKVFKPLAKIAIFEALIGALMEIINDEGGDEEVTDPANPEI